MVTYANEILLYIKETMNTKLQISKHCLIDSYFDKPVSGEPFFLSSVDMVYLVFELEKAFCVKIDEQFFSGYRLCSLNSLVEAVVAMIDD